MQKRISISIIIVAIIIVSGITIWVFFKSNEKTPSTNTDGNSNDLTPFDNNKNCTILTARELYENMTFNLSQQTDNPGEVTIDKDIFNLSYASFSEGDCIIIHDNISIIAYYPEYDYTSVCFSWYTDEYTKVHVYYHFETNITNTYNEGDLVEIKLHLKHVDVETTNMIYHIDIFDEQWSGEEYFINNVQDILIDEGLKPIDPMFITGVE